MNENESYIFGLLITDGSMCLNTRNRGNVRLEVSEKDFDIVEKLFNEIPGSKISSRIRNTNFSKNYKTSIFSNYKKEFRDFLINCGFPIKDKTNLADKPKIDFNIPNFWRGVIDGDGSIGITSKGLPFISLVTKSENLKESYLSFLKDNFKIEKKINRNKRDNVYNIMVSGPKSIPIIKYLYIDNLGISLNRKYNKAKEIINKI